MISRHHYPTPPTDDLARIAAKLDAEDAENGAWPPAEWWAKHAAEFNYTPPRLYVGWASMDEPPTATVTFGPVKDCPAIRDNQGNAVDIGEPWPRGWLGRAVVNVLFFAAWLLGGALAGLFAAWAGGVL